MAVTVDELQIEISDNSSKAAGGLQKLTAALTALKAITSGGLGIGRISAELKELTDNVGAMKAVNTAMRSLSKTISDMQSLPQRALGADTFLEGLESSSAVAQALEDIKAAAKGAGDALKQVVPKLEIPTTDLTEFNKALEESEAAWKEFKEYLESAEIDLTGLPQTIKPIVDAADKASERFKSLKTAISSIPGILGEIGAAAKSAFGFLANAIQKATSGIKKLVNNVLHLNSAFKSTNKQAGFFGTTIGKALKSILLYRTIRKLITQIGQAFRDGVRNISLFSDTANAAMSSIITDTLYLKNALGSLAAPVIEALAPAFRILTDVIVEATNALGMFIALLTGKSTFVKATRDMQD